MTRWKKTKPQETPLLDGLEPHPPFQKHSDTSKEAASKMKAPAKGLRATVFEHLRSLYPGGATDEEMQRELEIGPSTQRPRRIELVQADLVQDSGTTRKTAAGRKAVVWRLTHQAAAL